MFIIDYLKFAFESNSSLPVQQFYESHCSLYSSIAVWFYIFDTNSIFWLLFWLLATWSCKYLIFHTYVTSSTRIQSLKHMRSMKQGCKDIGISKWQFVLNFFHLRSWLVKNIPWIPGKPDESHEKNFLKKQEIKSWKQSQFPLKFKFQGSFILRTFSCQSLSIYRSKLSQWLPYRVLTWCIFCNF